LKAGILSPPFLKGDLGGLLGTYLIPPDPPLEKGGRKTPTLIAILIVKRHYSGVPFMLFCQRLILLTAIFFSPKLKSLNVFPWAGSKYLNGPINPLGREES
jgi:hypothetical protein